MNGNPHTGEVLLRLPEWPAYRLCFDWAALAKVQADFGEQALRIVTGNDVNALLALTVIGLRRHHPDVTVEDLQILPAALVPLALAVGQALNLAYNGPGDDKPNPPNRAARRTLARQKKKSTRSAPR